MESKSDIDFYGSVSILTRMTDGDLTVIDLIWNSLPFHSTNVTFVFVDHSAVKPTNRVPNECDWNRIELLQWSSDKTNR